MRKQRIRVRILKGLFPGERVIEATDLSGHVYRTYVTESEISHDSDGDNEGSVEVQVLEREDEFATIVLPGESAGPENNLMTIRAEQLLVPA